MPTISMFYGIIVYMYFFDDKKHFKPHIHVEYAEYAMAISIKDGDVIVGDFPKKQLKMVQAWIAIHEDELMADWKLATQGHELFRIEPLR
jgi:Domain of unknown function (DUF4160)